jgi:hypothetical protein
MRTDRVTGPDLDDYVTGTLAGVGSFRCRECGFAVALHALDEVPKCPNCGNARFARASLFESFGGESHEPLSGDVDHEWLQDVRDGLEESGHYLAYRDENQISVMPLTRECTRIGRSLTADIRFDDPTVSRRHAIIVRQRGVPRILDDRSLNGVFVNGHPVEWAELADGAELIIGRYRLYFIDRASEALRAKLSARTALSA